MSIVVTGASSHLGRLTVEALLRRGVPAADIARITTFAERGVVIPNHRRAIDAAVTAGVSLVASMSTEGHTDAVYELGGDKAVAIADALR